MSDYTPDYYFDAVGRRRKLSESTMNQIRKAYANGATTGELAQAYGITKTLVGTVCYNTARKADLAKEARFFVRYVDAQGRRRQAAYTSYRSAVSSAYRLQQKGYRLDYISPKDGD